LKLDSEGTYQCMATGLVFEVEGKITITYSVLSWSKYSMHLKKPWKIVGPLFDIDCDPTILIAVHFPHSLCLGDHDAHMKLRILHFKKSTAIIEPSHDHSGSHVKWNVTSLSPMGPIAETSEPAGHHGVVLIYMVVGHGSSTSFRIHFSANNNSEIQDIYQDCRTSCKRYIKIDKPPVCQKLLEENKKYKLISEPEADVTPQEIQFVTEVLAIKPYFEVYYEQPTPFKISLVEADSDQVIWTTALREGQDMVLDIESSDHISPVKGSKGIKRRRSSNTSDEEDNNFKSPKWNDMTDGQQRSTNACVTDKQIMAIAQRLDKKWKEIAITCLNLSKKDIDRIQGEEDDLTMQKFLMLDEWRNKKKNDATLRNLSKSLRESEIPVELNNFLEGMETWIRVFILHL
ncbi:NLRP1 protein, partial [Polypterus senegalus]|nr:NLRP1 protein [Polypterus senegalus]